MSGEHLSRADPFGAEFVRIAHSVEMRRYVDTLTGLTVKGDIPGHMARLLKLVEDVTKR
jgi:hypothetical protein